MAVISSGTTAAITVVLAMGIAGAQTVSTRIQIRSQACGQLSKGLEAFENSQYPEALDHFRSAVNLDPSFTTSRLYLASAYQYRFIDGERSAESLKMAGLAEHEFQLLLEQDAMNESAVASLAQLYLYQRKFEKAGQWYRRLLLVNPRNKVAYSNLGVIAWTKVSEPRMQARARMGMKPDDPGPLTDSKRRLELVLINRPLIEEGIEYLNEAIRLDPEYEDATAYQYLLYHEKADLEDSPEAYQADQDIANNFFQKSLDIRIVKASRKPLPGFSILHLNRRDLVSRTDAETEREACSGDARP